MVLKPICGRPPKARCLEANHTARLPKQVQNAANMFSQTTLNVNITKLFCGLHSMLLLLPTAAILETVSHKPVNSMWITRTITAKQKVRQNVPGLYAVCRQLPVSHVMFLTRSDNNIICRRTVKICKRTVHKFFSEGLLAVNKSETLNHFTNLTVLCYMLP